MPGCCSFLAFFHLFSFCIPAVSSTQEFHFPFLLCCSASDSFFGNCTSVLAFDIGNFSVPRTAPICLGAWMGRVPCSKSQAIDANMLAAPWVKKAMSQLWWETKNWQIILQLCSKKQEDQTRAISAGTAKYQLQEFPYKKVNYRRKKQPPFFLLLSVTLHEY